MLECTGFMFGQDCGETCDCDLNNTLSCHHVNGSCYCKLGFKGDKCEEGQKTSVPVCLSVCLFVCLLVFLSVCLSVCLSACFSVCLSVYLLVLYLIHHQE